MNTVHTMYNHPSLVAWRAGCDADAVSMVKFVFEKFFVRRGAEVFEADYHALEVIKFLLGRGRLEEVLQFFGRLGPIPEILSEHFYLYHKALGLTLLRIAKSRQEIASDRILVCLPIWGDAYRTIWERAGLSAFLGQCGITFLKNRNVEFHVYTLPADRELLIEMPGMRMLSEHAEIHWFNLDTILNRDGARNFLAMNIAQWASVFCAASFNAGVVLLFADTLFSAGSLATLDEVIDRGTHDAVFYADMQMSGRAWDELSRMHPGRDGLGNVTAAELTELFLAYPSSRELSWRVSGNSSAVPAPPLRLSDEFEGTVDLRTVAPQPIYLSSRMLEKLWCHEPNYLDYILVESARVGFRGSDRMLMLNDPARFMATTIDLADSGVVLPSQRMALDSSVVANLLVELERHQLLSQSRFWAYSQALLVGKGDRSALLDELQLRFEVQHAPASVLHEEYLDFSHDLLLPTLDEMYRNS